MYIEAEPGLEQDVLLFRIYQFAGKLHANLHLRTTVAGVWVRCPYPKYNAVANISDEVQMAIVGIEGEKQLCVMVNKITAGVAELEAVEISPRSCAGDSGPENRKEIEMSSLRVNG